MAEFINITDFKGVKTNADVEDISEVLAQNIENLKIIDGQLVKTFAAGEASSIPPFALAKLNTKLSGSYSVYNIFTFISDKFSTPEHRYILTLVDSNNVLQLWWYDPTVPAITEHLQIEDDVFLFTTASDSGIAQSQNIMAVNFKDNTSSAIANTDTYQTVNYKTGNKHYVNTNSVAAWGKSFFETAYDTGLRATSIGGFHHTHCFLSDNASLDDDGDGVHSFTNIALLAQSGKVLCMYSYDVGSVGRIRITVGGSTAQLNTTLYNQFKGYQIADNINNSFRVVSLINFSDAIYVYYSANNGSQYYNAIVKYTVETNGTVTETGVFGHAATNHGSTYWGDNNYVKPTNEAYFYEAGDGNLYLLVPGDGLFKVSSSAVTEESGTPSNTSGYSWIGITSITSSHSGTNHEYLILGETTGANHKFHFLDILDNSASWFSGATLDNELKLLSKMDFGEDSGTNESIVKYTAKSGNNFLQYSTHSNSSALGMSSNGWSDISSSVFTQSTIITRIKHTYKSPTGAKYLMVCTNDSGSFGSGMEHGRVYRVDSNKNPIGMQNNAADTYKGWNPTCIDDVVTGTSSGNQFFKHAKGYIVAYGIEYTTHSSDASLNNLPKGALARLTDIGWASGSWAGNGTLDYGWTNIGDKYSFTEIDESNVSSTPTVYHNRDKNPIIPTNDTIRFIPGAIGKVSNSTNSNVPTEAKGVWIGHIDRSLFNGTVSYPANWYAYVNKINNPFSLVEGSSYKSSSDMRSGNTVKYNVTAVYDGLQETLFDKSKELEFTSDDSNKTIYEIKVIIANINNLNKRITGLNIYRSIGSSGFYANYQLLGHMTFVDSGSDLTSVGSLKNVTVQGFDDRYAHIKVGSTLQNSLHNNFSYTETWLGANRYALGVAGGWDGIDDSEIDFSGSAGTNKIIVKNTVFATARKMNNSQMYMVVSSSTGIIGSQTLQIEDATPESVTTQSTPVIINADEDTGFSLNGDHVLVNNTKRTFTVTADISYYIKPNDVLRIYVNPPTNPATYILVTVNSVGTTTFEATPGASGTVAGAIKLHNVASGEHIIDLSHRGQNSTSMVTHLNNSAISKVPVHDYIRYKLDSDANLGNSYLDDDGIFRGSSWMVESRSGGSYSDSVSSSQTAFGAYSGKNIGFLQPESLIDFNLDITVNELTGSVIIPLAASDGDAYEIEANSAFDHEIGGVWIKTSKTIAAEASPDACQLMPGFNLNAAKGSSTPGMGFSKDGNRITISCRDFKLPDLGETDTQTIFSNRVNGQFAKQLKGRLFLGNVYLNPDDKAEDRKDWVAYSEINQYDNIPVSNVISFNDREGGNITGLAALFNRLVVFKRQAIFILSVADPTTPSTWSIVESKHNIGNIAPQGVVEIHDSVYFVYHDGIYEITSNMAASSTATPSVMNKISEDIEDQFNLATDKTQIVSIFDPNRREIIFKWLESSTQRVWGFNYVLKTWRKIDMGSFALDCVNYDENGSPIDYDKTNNTIIKFDTNNASLTKWKSKKFPLDLHRKRLVRYMTIQYTGSDSMTANVYLDGSGSASFSKTGLTAGTTRFPVKRYANRVELELTSPSSTNELTIKRLQLEVE